MKSIKLSSIVFALLLIACTTTPKKETTVTTELGDFTPYNVMPEYLNGKVKSVSELNYWGLQQGDEFVKGEIINKQERDSIHWTYDFEAFFTSEGVIEQVKNNIGHKTKSNWKITTEDNYMQRAEYFKKDTLRKFYLRKFDEAGCLMKQKTFGAEDTVPRTLYKFECNENNKWVAVIAKSQDGTFKGKYKLKRNTDHTVNTFYVLAEDDSVKSKTIQVYNDKGFYTEMKSYDGADSLKTTVTMEYLTYDDVGNWTSAKAVMDDLHIIYTERSYTYYDE